MRTKNSIAFVITILFSISASVGQEISPIPESNNRDQAQKISREQILKTTDIEEILSNFPKADYVVTQYKLSIFERGKEPAEFANEGNQLTVLMKERIKTASPGAKLYFEYIKGRPKSNQGITKLFPPSAFVIVEK